MHARIQMHTKVITHGRKGLLEVRCLDERTEMSVDWELCMDLERARPFHQELSYRDDWEKKKISKTWQFGSFELVLHMGKEYMYFISYTVKSYTFKFVPIPYLDAVCI